MNGGNDGYFVRVVTGPSAGAIAPLDGPLVVGREGDLLVADPAVSRRHLQLTPRGRGVSVRDLGSSGGTTMEGAPVLSEALVSPGAEIALGRSTLRLLRLQRFPDAAAQPALVFSPPGPGVVSVQDSLVVGRDTNCDVVLADPSVSRRHAMVHVDDDGVHLEDLGSTSGTWIADRPVQRRSTLLNGAAVRFGTTDATFVSASVDAGSLSVRVVQEPATETETVTIELAADSTVAEVTAALATALDVRSEPLLLYRSEDGLLLHADDLWCATGPQRGDRLVLGVGDTSALRPARERQWPPARRASLNQLPRTVWPERAFSVERLDPPESTSWRGRGVLWQLMGGFGAVAAGIVLAFVQPTLGFLGLIAGAVGILTISASIFADQSRRRQAETRFRSKLALLERSLWQAGERQGAALRALRPNTQELDEWIRHRSPRVWERRPEHLDALRPTLGTGKLEVLVDVAPSPPTDSPLATELDAVLARHRWLSGVPVSGPGPSEGSLGLAGAPDPVRQLTQRIVVEAAVLHPPHQLKIWVASTDRSWEWCRWLPHIAGDGPSRDVNGAARLLAELTAELGQRADHGAAPPADLLHLLIVPGSFRRLSLDVLGVLRARGLAVITAVERTELPNGLAVLVDVGTSRGATVTGDYPGAPIGPIEVAGISDRAAEQLAVGLGRLTGSAAPRRRTGLLDLLGLAPLAQLDVERAWLRGPAELLCTPVGTATSGETVTIGFRRDGPHGMIAGTTGSGKSELLQTMLTGLALTHAPAQLNFFLIDFKGGSTFAPLAPLPHVVGLVTDIEHDTALARRAFTALTAEIERRKRILEKAGVADISAHERLPTGQREPLPNLLVVIDEFALLVEKQPEVKQRLDTVATQGRSLGIHLLLATQSPSGVVSHAIRTNTNLWICLRVVTDAESVELLGSRAAARLPDDAPGRAILRLGASEDLHHFQASRVAQPLTGERCAVRVTQVGDRKPPAPPSTGPGGTELQVLVERMVAAGTSSGAPKNAVLWVPPLPDLLDLIMVADADRPTDRLISLIGLADYPELRRQQPFLLDLSAAGNALVSGMLGYGRSTTLLQIGADLAEHYGPDQLHLYGIDAGAGSLAPLAELPHVASIVGASDAERLTRVFDRLTKLIERRRDQLATSGAGTFTRWRATGGSAPWVVLLMDDHAAFREVAEQMEQSRLLERFTSLLQNGPAVGIHVVVSISQATDLRLREMNLIPHRLVLRSADPADHDLVGMRVSRGEVRDLPPGRALSAGGVFVQVCWRDPSALTTLPVRAPADDEDLPRPVLRLPVAVDRAQLAQPTDGLVLGLGGVDVEPVCLDLDDGIPALLVAGPGRSGRSTALVSFVAGLRAREPASTLVLAPRPGPLHGLLGQDKVVVVDDPERIVEALDIFTVDESPQRVLVIDDAEMLSKVFGLGERLETILRNADRTGVRVLVGARASDLPALFDPWARYLVSLRRTVLLQPTADDAFLFGARLPTIPPPRVPGRGVLVDGGEISVLQVASTDLGAPVVSR